MPGVRVPGAGFLRILMYSFVLLCILLPGCALRTRFVMYCYVFILMYSYVFLCIVVLFYPDAPSAPHLYVFLCIRLYSYVFLYVLLCIPMYSCVFFYPDAPSAPDLLYILMCSDVLLCIFYPDALMYSFTRMRPPHQIFYVFLCIYSYAWYVFL